MLAFVFWHLCFANRGEFKSSIFCGRGNAWNEGQRRGGREREQNSKYTVCVRGLSFLSITIVFYLLRSNYVVGFDLCADFDFLERICIYILTTFSLFFFSGS